MREKRGENIRPRSEMSINNFIQSPCSDMSRSISIGELIVAVSSDAQEDDFTQAVRSFQKPGVTFHAQT
jgi:hypothetical protein